MAVTTDIEDEILHKNINNMFYLSIYIILSETVMLITYFQIKSKLDPLYRSIYMGMYLFFLLFGFVTALFLVKKRKKTSFESAQRRFLNLFLIAFILTVMLWGVIITLLDQSVYGQIIAFVTNYVCCACLLLVRPRTFILTEAVPLTALFLLLPFFQENSDVLIGHYINILILMIPLTVSSCRTYVTFQDNSRNVTKIKDFSEKDELTNLYNRRKLNHYIDAETVNIQDNILSAGVLMMDVDYFKRYNDTYGHIQGDYVLQSIGAVLKETASEQDIFTARYGGEEFIVIIQNKNPEQVSEIAEEIKKKIDRLRIPHKTSDIADTVTVSIGQYYSNENQTQIIDMVKKADEALYEAKHRGRNQIYRLTD